MDFPLILSCTIATIISVLLIEALFYARLEQVVRLTINEIVVAGAVEEGAASTTDMPGSVGTTITHPLSLILMGITGPPSGMFPMILRLLAADI